MTSRQALALLEQDHEEHLQTTSEDVLSQTLSQMSLEHDQNHIEQSGITS